MENTPSEEGKSKKTSHGETSKEWGLRRKVSIRESVSDSGVPERKLSESLDANKRGSLRSQDAVLAEGKAR